MELWQDFQSGKFYSINKNSGKQSPSNRFGSEKNRFVPYSSGFSHSPQKLSTEPENPNKTSKLYAVQPEKFDGYCQYPRPLQKATSNRSPFIRSNVASAKLLIKQKEKIPTPLKFLELSQNRSLAPQTSASLPVQNFKTLEDFKNLYEEKQFKEMKTVSDLSIRMETEKSNKSGFIRPKTKTLRRKLKGFFLKDFKTGAELSKEEKRITEITNPKFYEKIRNRDELDLILLKKTIRLSRKANKSKNNEK